MGYKRIDSAIRNFAHSFVSVMNYVDDVYIIDLMPKLLRETPGHEIRLSLLDDFIEPFREYDRRFLKSVGYYRQRVRDISDQKTLIPTHSITIILYCSRIAMARFVAPMPKMTAGHFIKSKFGPACSDPKMRRTKKCTRVADRAFPEIKVTWRQPGDFERYPIHVP